MQKSIQWLFILLLCNSMAVIAQHKMGEDSGAANPILDFKVNYTYQTPAGDLANRFGLLHHIGAGVNFKTKNNWCVDAELGYQFGDELRETNLLVFLTNSSGYVMNSGGAPASIYLGERGLTFTTRIGRLFPLSQGNRNSGILIMLGAGYFMHKINITTPSNNITMLSDAYKRGYDRLTAGFGYSEFVGYMFHSKNRYVNFYIGFDFTQAFTKSLRGYNYDQMKSDISNRMDATIGYRFGWTFPVYFNSSNKDEFEYK